MTTPSRFTVAALLPLLPAGCAGSARMNFVSLNHAAIDPPAPVVHRFEPQQCSWWIDDLDRLNVAMQFDQFSPFNKFGEMTLRISLVLDAPPAGSGRNYTAGPDTLRGHLATPLDQHRFSGLTGIVAVSRRGKARLSGSYRLWVRHHPGLSLFSLFPQQPGLLLLFGTFDAVHDPRRGAVIRAECESNGWTRPAPTTQPHTQSAR
jgi:hypothetical protein